jgi:hypothetical protein
MEELKTHLPLDIFYVNLDWPVIPNDLCQELIDFAKTAKNIWEGEKNNYSTFAQYNGPESLISWVQNNLSWIPKDYQIRLQGIPNSTELSMHKDAMRGSSYNFVLTDDGSTTHWYNDQSEKIHSVKYTPRTWHQHQSQVAHSVDGGEVGRLAVTIFKFELQQWFKKQMYP